MSSIKFILNPLLCRCGQTVVDAFQRVVVGCHTSRQAHVSITRCYNCRRYGGQVARWLIAYPPPARFEYA